MFLEEYFNTFICLEDISLKNGRYKIPEGATVKIIGSLTLLSIITLETQPPSNVIVNSNSMATKFFANKDIPMKLLLSKKIRLVPRSK